MKPDTIVIHHSVSSRDKTTIPQINEWHKARDFTLSSMGYYIGYHYVIMGDGTVTQVRKDDQLGCHVLGKNLGKIGICLTGNFMADEPSRQQIESLENLCDTLKERYQISEVYAHREFSKTECCGDNLFKWILESRISWLQKLINILLNKIIK